MASADYPVYLTVIYSLANVEGVQPLMIARSPRIDDICALREFVHEVLCNYNQLEIGAFQMTETVLTRSGKPCGMFFCLHGPRSVKLTAVWETDGNSIFFYGSTGERQHRTQVPYSSRNILALERATA